MKFSPEVSVIICTYNRAKYLAQCLEYLKVQSAAPDTYEIIIVNNNSPDNSEAICLKFIRNNKHLNIRYHIEYEPGLSFARNAGILLARGKILSFIDDDAFAERSFIENVIRFFKKHKEVQAIGGKIVPEYETGKPKWISPYLLTLVAALDLGEVPKKFKGSKFPIGANMTFRSEVFKKYGLFDVRLGRKGSNLEAGEEKDLFNRLRRNNEVIMYAPGVAVKHIIPPGRTTSAYIRRQAYGIGRSEKIRLSNKGIANKLEKLISEFVKIAGSLILFFGYSFLGKWDAGWMFLKFRYWVIYGYFKK